MNGFIRNAVSCLADLVLGQKLSILSQQLVRDISLVLLRRPVPLVLVCSHLGGEALLDDKDIDVLGLDFLLRFNDGLYALLFENTQAHFE